LPNFGVWEGKASALRACADHPSDSKPLGLTRRLVAAAKNIEEPANAVVLLSGSGAKLVASAQEGCSVLESDINPE